MGRAWFTGIAAAGALAHGLACSGAPPPVSRIEDKARLDVPIAICRRALTGTETVDGGVLPGDAYWSVLMPNFRAFGAPLNPSDPDCVGGHHADAPPGAPALSPFVLGTEDAVVTAAEDGTQIVWLRAFRQSDAIASGPLAFVRARASEIDVYALGSYRGSARHSRFVPVRIGAARAIVVYDESCADAKVDVECESTLRAYLVVGGKLEAAAESPLQRLRYGTLKGLGRVQYRLSTDPAVVDKATLRVHERLQVRDSADEDVRKAEGDRLFVLGSDGRLVPQQDSLWAQVPKNP